MAVRERKMEVKQMKKYLCAAVAILILAACFTGCGKKNVSDDPNGRITDPTVETPTMIPEPTVTGVAKASVVTPSATTAAIQPP